jgi:VWFA-related protein
MRTSIQTTFAISAAALLLFAGNLAARAQQAPPAPQPATLQAQVNEVLLDMVVHDRSNKPVTDLQPADIAVTDNGQPVTLTQLRLVNGKQQDPALVTLLFNRPGFDPGQKSTSTAAQSVSKRLHEASSRILKLIPDGSFDYSVLDVWGRLQVQLEMSGDRKAVDGAIGAAVEPGQFGVATTLNPVETALDKEVRTGQDGTGKSLNPRALALSQSLGSAIADSIQKVAGQHVPDGLACLQALVDAERPVAGRKAIIYFTTTTQLTGESITKQQNNSDTTKSTLQAIVGAANRAGINLYIVRMDDPNSPDEMGSLMNSFADASLGSSNAGPPGQSKSSGSGGPATNGMSNAVGGAMASASEFQLINSKQGEITATPGSLDALVRGTGGYSFSEDESFAPPVKEMVNDLTTYYEASYVPNVVNDGAFHAVTVKPLRSGLKIRTRSGYLATPLK